MPVVVLLQIACCCFRFAFFGSAFSAAAKSARTDNWVLKERVFNARWHRDNLLVDVFGSDGIADVALAQGGIFCVVTRSDSALLVLLKSRDNFWDD